MKCFATAASALALAASTLTLAAPAATAEVPTDVGASVVSTTGRAGRATDGLPSARLLRAVDNIRDARPGERTTADGKSVAAFSAAAKAAIRAAMAERGLRGDPAHYNCDWQRDSLHGKFNHDLERNLWWDVYEQYYACKPERGEHDRLRFVAAAVTRGSYNLEGTHFGCPALSLTFKAMRVNMYFKSDVNGANFNPGEFTVPCDESTQNSATQAYKREDVPRLYIRDEGDAKFKANVTLVRTLSDSHDSKYKAFTPSW